MSQTIRTPNIVLSVTYLASVETFIRAFGVVILVEFRQLCWHRGRLRFTLALCHDAIPLVGGGDSGGSGLIPIIRDVFIRMDLRFHHRS